MYKLIRIDMKKILSFSILFSIFFLGFGKDTLQKITVDGFTQSTYYRVIYFAEEKNVTEKEIDAFLADFMQTASLWEQNSIISKINRNEKVELNDQFETIYRESNRVSQLTDGAFDITIGSLVNFWGFGPKQSQATQTRLIDSLKRYIGYQKIKIENHYLIKEDPHIELDLNAIAKGYSVDLVSQLLRTYGIENFLVNIGGEIRVSGGHPDGSPWILAIEKPAENASAEAQIQQVMVLQNESMATSGSYRKYREKDGLRYSHTVDPRTGYPVSHNLLSSTVIAKDCLTADALATAFMVMGADKALDFLKQHPEYQGYFITSREDGGFTILYSEGFEKYFIEQY